MGKKSKEIKVDQKKAYELMDEKQLIFILKDKSEIKRLISYVKGKNKQIYNKAEFEFIPSNFDEDLIVAAVPDLGPDQVGLFAGRNFRTNEEVASYEGKDLWGKLPIDQLKEKITNCEESGDYFWEFASNNGGMAIDSSMVGSVARFVNDSLERNLYVEVADGKLYYKARRNINFGEELTVSYGSTYFNETNRRIGYVPKNLQTILSKLFALRNEEEFNYFELKNLDEVHNFTQLLGWNSGKINKKSYTQTIDKFQLPDDRDNRNTRLYLSQNKPLIFLLSNPNDFQCDSFIEPAQASGTKFLQQVANMQFCKTSSYDLFVAPTMFEEGKRRFSLFAGELIKKNDIVCTIEGEKLSQKEINDRKDLDPNLLFELSSKFNLYCKNIGSEAVFIQGASTCSEANVKLSLERNCPKYIATEDIKPGNEILAFFEGGYKLTAKATSLTDIVYEFNRNQLQYDAHHGKTNDKYYINFYPHIMTPGRDLDYSYDQPKIRHDFKNSYSAPPSNFTPMSDSDLYDYEDLDPKQLIQQKTCLMSSKKETSSIWEKNISSTQLKSNGYRWQPNFYKLVPTTDLNHENNSRPKLKLPQEDYCKSKKQKL